MPIQNPKDLFIWMLSDVRRREERSGYIAQELLKQAEDPDVKEVLDSWMFMKDKTVSTIDHCFKLLNAQPVSTTGRIHEVFLEDFLKEINEIQNPQVKVLYFLSKLSQMMHLQIGEYQALTAMADISGHTGVGALVETCLASYLVFVDRARNRIANLIMTAAAMRRAA